MSTEFQFTQLTMAESYTPVGSQDVTTKAYVDAEVNGAGGVPAGVISAFGGTTPPTSWLMCDGTGYAASSYPDLYSAIGGAFGVPSSGFFNVPDLRGRFLRGRDGGAGRDPDASSREGIPTGANSGDNVGSVQGDQVQTHTHTFSASTADLDSGAGAITAGAPGGGQSIGAITIGSFGGSETRPVNAYVNFIIKS